MTGVGDGSERWSRRRPARGADGTPGTTWRRHVAPVFRLTAAAQAALALLQATSAGHMLGRSTAARSLHESVGTEVISWLVVVQLLVAVVQWRVHRGPPWPVLLVAGTLPLLVLQITWGFGGRLALHLPAGMLFLAVQVTLATRGQRPPAVAG